MKKTVTIVIPAFNEERYLTACLDSIAAQTEAPDEVIVVDNNSTDRTAEIARTYPFVTLLSEPCQGLYYARNTGLNYARGAIIGRIDADTMIDPSWVASVKRVFLDTTVAAVSGPVGYHDMPFPLFVQRSEDLLLRVARAGRYDFLMGANMAISRGAWQKVRASVCNEAYLLEDIDIAVHLRMLGMSPVYTSSVKATVSARRLLDKPAAFARYIGGHTRTWEYHGFRPPIGAYYAEIAYGFTYLWARPLHLTFDPAARRLSLTRLLLPIAARPNPMAPMHTVSGALQTIEP